MEELRIKNRIKTVEKDSGRRASLLRQSADSADKAGSRERREIYE